MLGATIFVALAVVALVAANGRVDRVMLSMRDGGEKRENCRRAAY